jgi:phosphate transport system substrate-binding protein
MYRLNKPQKSSIKRILRKSRAVSPVIATLVLIVVAIVGAISVGLIMSRVSTDTAGQANVQNAVGNSQQNLLVGGSSPIAPVVEDAIPTIESQEHIQVQYVLSSSSQGLEGLNINALDVAAVASYASLQAGISYASSSYPGVNLVSTLVGGSGVVVIENGATGTGSFLTDGANVCYGITKAALALIYKPSGTGYFTIDAAACAHGYLDSTGITASVAAATPGAIETVYRSDNSAIQTVFGTYIGSKPATTGNAYAGAGESGDAGILSTVQSAPGANNPGGWIGFIDFGYASGAAAGVAGDDADGVSIAQVFSSLTSTGGLTGDTFGPLDAAPYTTGTYTTPAVTTPTGYPLAILDGSSATNVSNLILSGLQQSTSSVFPDTAAVAGSTLVTTFYFVTNGNPTTTEENFISFFTQSSASSEAFWTSNGFFDLYQINAGA